MEFESRLIPIMREGIDVIKMIFFRKLRSYLSKRYANEEGQYINMLAGAIINDLFGTPSTVEPFATFIEKNRARIEGEMQNIPIEFSEMKIPLTDALRIQFLCDHQEGIDSSSVLQRAKDLGILIVDREVPLPASFTSMVRKLGGAFGILMPLSTA